MSEKNYITPQGYKRLVDELTELATVERPRVVREVSDAAAEGDRSENAAYIYGKRRLREIDRRMGFLSRRLKHVQVVKPEEARRDRVFFGAWVEVEDGEGESLRYQIVGVDEVEADKGRISWKSPIGRALLGKKVDDTVMVRWHAGERELTIVDIAYDAPATGAPLPPLPATIAGDDEPGGDEDDEPVEDDDEPDEDDELDEDDEPSPAAATRATATPKKPAPTKKPPKAKPAAKTKAPARGKRR